MTSNHNKSSSLVMNLATSQQTQQQSSLSSTRILSSLDNLPLGKWHLFVMLALGLVWIFDGYEVTLISIYRPQIQEKYGPDIWKAMVTAYQIGGMVGSLVFGICAFIVGRRKIFLVRYTTIQITLVLYFFGVLFSGLDLHPLLFIFARFITGLSVGGQFTAIFTGIDQFMPPSYRGRVNIGIDGTWHLGGTMAAVLTLLVDEDHWREMFFLGWVGIVALGIMRKNVPESPRWLLVKGREREAKAVIQAIVETVRADDVFLHSVEQPQQQIATPSSSARQSQLSQHLQSSSPHSPQPTFCSYLHQILILLHQSLTKHPRKFMVAFSLIFTQALFFNLIYYQYPDILSNQFNLEQKDVSLYMLPLSITSFVSTLVVGPFFDKIGRRKLLLLTCKQIHYIDCSSGVLLLITYAIHSLMPRQVMVCILFLFASPAGSSANLISSQIFPTSSRTIMLFVMFIVSMLGGSVGVWFDNHYVAAVMMILAGIFAFLFCPNAENKTLEQIQKM